MRTYSVSLGDSVINVNAESFNQAGDYVSFYADKQAIALVRLGLGDSVVQTHDTECPDCGTPRRQVSEAKQSVAEPSPECAPSKTR